MKTRSSAKSADVGAAPSTNAKFERAGIAMLAADERAMENATATSNLTRDSKSCVGDVVESTRVIPVSRVALAFDASYEISSLALILRRMIHEENMDGFGKACCGILIRIEQLGEALSACIDPDPVGNYGLDDHVLQARVRGANAHAVEGA